MALPVQGTNPDYKKVHNTMLAPSSAPALSSTNAASTSLDVLSDANLIDGDGSDVEDIDELFGDIDWATANFTELEAQWHTELESIEKVPILV